MRPSAPRSLLSAFWAKPLLPSSSPWSAWLSVSAWEIVEYRSYRHSRKKHKKHKGLDSFVAFAFFAANLTFALKRRAAPLSKPLEMSYYLGRFPPRVSWNRCLGRPEANYLRQA